MFRCPPYRLLLCSMGLAGMTALMGCGEQPAPGGGSPARVAQQPPTTAPAPSPDTATPPAPRIAHETKELTKHDAPKAKEPQGGVAPPAVESSRDYSQLLQLIKATPAESSWLSIPWMLDLNEARRKAAAEGKPLVVWTTSGEPLGRC